MIIYKVQNKITNKVYIGQTVNSLEQRKNEHIKFSKTKNTHFLNALRSYGERNFTWEVIDTAKTKEELNEKEIKYIQEYNSIENGYNMIEGGTGGYNKFAVEANKKKRKGKTYSQIYSSPEMVERVLQSRRKNVNDNFKKFTKEKRTEYGKMGAEALNNSGYKHSEETKRKISESQKGITLEDRLGEEKAIKRKKLISKKTKEAMSKLDKSELLKKALIGREKYWNNKHQEDREKILELKKQGLKVKEIIANLNVSYPTYYARLEELKKEGKL